GFLYKYFIQSFFPSNSILLDVKQAVADRIRNVVQDVSESLNAENIIQDGVVEGVRVESLWDGKFALEKWDEHTVLHEFLESSWGLTVEVVEIPGMGRVPDEPVRAREVVKVESW
ncbi:hypothetical protein, partial [Salmonella sp. s51884]|uniref:hypothetical protein n=1 Tax=Salmonella sp. s51884 TaxID=3159654 RepID=UPI003980CC76